MQAARQDRILRTRADPAALPGQGARRLVHGCRVRCVVVVVVETSGRDGMVVVVSRLVVVRVTGGGGSEQPASNAMPASSAKASAWRDRLVLWVIV